ncbi:O-antigen polymerase [Silicimonas sp. MF1-12-2]|uniref:O-antigen polymerase n=1 Tax=Silicimonas sp. MF1-12-2 TaxID=3384793 RepID=UPI0039B6C8F4
MKAPWWFSPIWIDVFWIILIWATLFIGYDAFTSMIKASKFVTLEFTIACTLMHMMFILGAAIFSLYGGRPSPLEAGHDWLRLPPQQRFVLPLMFFTVLAVAAYVVWLGPTLSPEVLKLVLSGAGRRVISEHANQISGVTTATQFGIAIAYVSFLLLLFQKKGHRSRLLAAFILLFIALSILRAFVWSERLALIEITIPILVLWIAVINKGQFWIRFAPLLGILMAFTIFAVFEFFRSWQFYSALDRDFFGFAAERFAAYYLSSINNFAMLEASISPSWLPLNSAGFVFLFPGLEGLNEIKDNRVTQYYFLELFRNTTPEFNLFSGIGYLWDDFGWVGGGIAAFVFGSISGRLFLLFRTGSLVGLLFYPYWMVGLFDLGRILYWPGGRALPSFVVLLIVYLIIDAWKSRLRETADA